MNIKFLNLFLALLLFSGAFQKPDDRQWSGQIAVEGFDAVVTVLAVDGRGNLYAGGEFTSIDGVRMNHIARWDGSDWTPLGSGQENVVNNLAVDQSGNLNMALWCPVLTDGRCDSIAVLDEGVQEATSTPVKLASTPTAPPTSVAKTPSITVAPTTLAAYPAPDESRGTDLRLVIGVLAVILMLVGGVLLYRSSLRKG